MKIHNFKKQLEYFLKRPPTDLEILEEIYHRYYAEFTAYDKNQPNRDSKIYVLIDLNSIADRFNVDGDIIFGRVYYYLNKRFSFKNTDGTRVDFFVFHDPEFPYLHSHIHFPLMASAIAELRDSQNKYLFNTALSVGAFIIALIALF